MCGIVDIYHFDKQHPVREQDLAAMADQIVHRGPDDIGYFTAGDVGIGTRRSSMMDLASGHQTIQRADGEKTIVFNGELSNYRDQAKDLEARVPYLCHRSVEFMAHTPTDLRYLQKKYLSQKNPSYVLGRAKKALARHLADGTATI